MDRGWPMDSTAESVHRYVCRKDPTRSGPLAFSSQPKDGDSFAKEDSPREPSTWPFRHCSLPVVSARWGHSRLLEPGDQDQIWELRLRLAVTCQHLSAGNWGTGADLWSYDEGKAVPRGLWRIVFW